MGQKREALQAYSIFTEFVFHREKSGKWPDTCAAVRCEEKRKNRKCSNMGAEKEGSSTTKQSFTIQSTLWLIMVSDSRRMENVLREGGL